MTLEKAHPLRFIGALGPCAGIGLRMAVLRSL